MTHDLAFARRGTRRSLDLEQRLPEPTADAEAIERLLFARLEKDAAAGAPWRGWSSSSRGWRRRPASSCRCSRRRPRATPASAWQLARLAIAFGTDRVRRVEITDPEAPIPEARWRWVPVERARRCAVRAGP